MPVKLRVQVCAGTRVMASRSPGFLRSGCSQYLGGWWPSQIKGSPDPPVPVTLSGSVTGWGDALLSELAGAVGAPAVAEVWVRYSDGVEEGPLANGRGSWSTIKGLDPGDVVLVVKRPFPATRTLGGGDSRPLPDGEQRYKRLEQLIIQEPCVVPQLMQKVRVSA